MPRLSELQKGQKARVLKVHDSDIAARLLDLGCIPGELLHLSNTAPLGCPIAICIEGSELSLRKDEAQTVEVEILNP